MLEFRGLGVPVLQRQPDDGENAKKTRKRDREHDKDDWVESGTRKVREIALCMGIDSAYDSSRNCSLGGQVT